MQTSPKSMAVHRCIIPHIQMAKTHCCNGLGNRLCLCIHVSPIIHLWTKVLSDLLTLKTLFARLWGASICERMSWSTKNNTLISRHTPAAETCWSICLSKISTWTYVSETLEGCMEAMPVQVVLCNPQRC